MGSANAAKDAASSSAWARRGHRRALVGNMRRVEHGDLGSSHDLYLTESCGTMTDVSRQLHYVERVNIFVQRLGRGRRNRGV